MQFANRLEAGRQLAQMLAHEPQSHFDIILGLPRGGVIVAAEVATQFLCPLDVILVRKLGLPFHEELAIGAIDENCRPVLNDDLIRIYDLKTRQLNELISEQCREIHRRKDAYAAYRTSQDLANKSVLLVDDGIATGATLRASIAYVRTQKPKWLAAAVPVAAADTIDSIETLLDQLYCLYTPVFLDGVGQWYDEFSQVSDAEVIETLKAHQESLRKQKSA